jgi:hypothetical protein
MKYTHDYPHAERKELMVERSLLLLEFLPVSGE